MEIDWQLAGLTMDGGGVTRPVTIEGWRIPAVVELEGTNLRWRYRDGDRLGEVIRPRPRLLEAMDSVWRRATDICMVHEEAPDVHA